MGATMKKILHDPLVIAILGSAVGSLLFGLCVFLLKKMMERCGYGARDSPSPPQTPADQPLANGNPVLDVEPGTMNGGEALTTAASGLHGSHGMQRQDVMPCQAGDGRMKVNGDIKPHAPTPAIQDKLVSPLMNHAHQPPSDANDNAAMVETESTLNGGEAVGRSSSSAANRGVTDCHNAHDGGKLGQLQNRSVATGESMQLHEPNLAIKDLPKTQFKTNVHVTEDVTETRQVELPSGNFCEAPVEQVVGSGHEGLDTDVRTGNTGSSSSSSDEVVATSAPVLHVKPAEKPSAAPLEPGQGAKSDFTTASSIVSMLSCMTTVICLF